ncbi:hypothetical protein HU200_001026 [Digitaria exilis]|uniref:Phytocyanin domain-containing protein n=1 Tax=Digitaria exilis TaxID=1010633 RepID=A0A835FZT1_9POAL|nr:hypothetical protein HU200_001026 [Digitaria exilis]CAB3457359.1 unnamed protein product [Digitaria exilis]
MARLVPLIVVVVFAAASCGVLLAGASATPSRRTPADVYHVGDAKGWAVPPGNATDTLNRWATSHRFRVGDVLDFKYSKKDSVLLVRRGDYDGCGAARPVRRLPGGGGHTRFRLDRPGLFYFISGVPARCEAGERMVVHVVELGATAPAPAPAPAWMDEEPSHPSGDRPIPVAFRLFVAAGLGFVSGCFFAGLVLWLCINWPR